MSKHFQMWKCEKGMMYVSENIGLIWVCGHGTLSGILNLSFLPNLLGLQPLTVLPRSTSTKTRLPSIFLPSACL